MGFISTVRCDECEGTGIATTLKSNSSTIVASDYSYHNDMKLIEIYHDLTHISKEKSFIAKYKTVLSMESWVDRISKVHNVEKFETINISNRFGQGARITCSIKEISFYCEDYSKDGVNEEGIINLCIEVEVDEWK